MHILSPLCTEIYVQNTYFNFIEIEINNPKTQKLCDDFSFTMKLNICQHFIAKAHSIFLAGIARGRMPSWSARTTTSHIPN